MDIEISKKRLCGRIIYGLFLAAITLFLFYYLPTHFASLLEKYIPGIDQSSLNSVAESLSYSLLPEFGIILGILSFIQTIIKGTWVYGSILVAMGVFWLAFDLILFSRGLLFTSLLPSTLGQTFRLSQSVYALITDLLFFIVVTFVISSIATILRGGRILWRHRKREHGSTETVVRSKRFKGTA